MKTSKRTRQNEETIERVRFQQYTTAQLIRH